MPVRVEPPLRWISPNAIGSAPPPLGRFVLRSGEFPRNRSGSRCGRMADCWAGHDGSARAGAACAPWTAAGGRRVDAAGGPVRVTTGSHRGWPRGSGGVYALIGVCFAGRCR